MHGLRFLGQLIQIAGDGALQRWRYFVQRAQARLQCDRIAVGMTLFALLLLALLEASEIVLYQVSGIELAHGHLIIVARRRHNLVQQLGICALPNLFDSGAQFGIRIVDIALRFNAQRGAHHRKQRGIEQHRAVGVEGHVHGDETLAGHAMRTEFAEAQRRRYFTQQCDHIQMLDASLGIRIVFAPQAYELIQMMWAQDGPIPSQVVEIIHNDGHKQIDDLMRKTIS